MNSSASFSDLSPGTDCTEAFRAAYENRYTWGKDFPGYKGQCDFLKDGVSFQGTFQVSSDLKASVDGIRDELIQKELISQLWEVAIHRVRRTFEQVHGQNTFTIGDHDDFGVEVIVGGKNKGDRYRIKNNVVTMVHRHIHGRLVKIFTESTFQTPTGYLSKLYTSQYSDPTSDTLLSGVSHFDDTFTLLKSSNFWVLTERDIRTDSHGGQPSSHCVFKFSEITSL